MSKDKISDYSTTASDNTDIAGIGIQGTNAVSNFDGAFRTIMKQLADMNAGTSPLFDTFALCDPVDNTKKVRIDAGTVATATTRVLTMPDANVTISSFASTLLDDTTSDAVFATLGATPTAWTPTLTFATPGDLSVVYATQVGRYIKIGKQVTVSLRIITSTFTHTTASGELRITGLPFTAQTVAGLEWTGAPYWQGITMPAGRTDLASTIISAGAFIRFVGSGSAAGATSISSGNTTSGTNMTFATTITYETT